MSAPSDYAPAPEALKERTIVITGAGDGLGRAAALSCARHGAVVVLLGRTVSKLEKTYDDIRAAGGADPAIYPMNLAGASWNDYVELAATIEREFGKLHGLLHCAGHFKEFGLLQNLDPREWMESMQVNLTAPFALTRALLPVLEKSSNASVVFVTDGSRGAAKPYQSAYGVAKRALEGLMQIWAAELPKESGVRVNSFDPGPLRTGLRARGYPGAPSDAAPSAESAVPTLLWLLSDASQSVSGRQL